MENTVEVRVDAADTVFVVDGELERVTLWVLIGVDETVDDNVVWVMAADKTVQAVCRCEGTAADKTVQAVPV